MHKAVAFEPLAPAALFLRILITCIVIKVTCTAPCAGRDFFICCALARWLNEGSLRECHIVLQVRGCQQHLPASHHAQLMTLHRYQVTQVIMNLARACAFCTAECKLTRVRAVISGFPQGEVWQGCSYGFMALAAVGAAAGWALLLALKLALGFALKRIANLYVRHYDERHAKGRCGLRSLCHVDSPLWRSL